MVLGRDSRRMRVRMRMGIGDSLQLHVLLLSRIQGKVFVKHDDGAITIRRRKHEGLAIRCPDKARRG